MYIFTFRFCDLNWQLSTLCTRHNMFTDPLLLNKKLFKAVGENIVIITKEAIALIECLKVSWSNCLTSCKSDILEGSGLAKSCSKIQLEYMVVGCKFAVNNSRNVLLMEI